GFAPPMRDPNGELAFHCAVLEAQVEGSGGIEDEVARGVDHPAAQRDLPFRLARQVRADDERTVFLAAVVRGAELDLDQPRPASRLRSRDDAESVLGIVQ